MQGRQDDSNSDSDQEKTIRRPKLKKKGDTVPTKHPGQSPPEDHEDRPVARPAILQDDPCEEPKQNPLSSQTHPEEAYDLSKGLSLTVASDRSIVHCSKTNPQKLSTVVSLRTLEVTSQENQNLDELNPSKDRLGVDLIAVIDASGSMGSQGKMQSCKQALHSLLSFFAPQDRFGIVRFDAKATKLTGFKRVTPGNLDQISQVIDSKLKPGGSTSIPAGIREAVGMIADRGAHKNKIVSIFLLSDGNDNDQQAAETIRRMLEEKANGLEFVIHTFGFGDDHDSTLLSSIAKLRNGNFYYIQELSQIDECFVNAFGGLLSVVGREAKLTLQLKKGNEQIHELNDLKWLKPYGDFWKLDQQTNHYEVNIQNLINGMKRDYVIDIQIPKINADVAQAHREQIILSCELSAKTITNQTVVKKAELKVRFANEGDQEEESKESANSLSEDVVYNLFRVEVGELLHAVRDLAEHREHAQATKSLELLINKILVSKYAKSSGLQKLLEQLENAKESVKPENFEEYGRHELINESERTMKQAGLKAKKKVQQEQIQKADSDSEGENTIQRTMKRKLKKPQPPKQEEQKKPENLGLSTVLEQSAIKENESSIYPKKPQN